MDARLGETHEPETPDEDFGYGHANLYPRTTGLPMTVWVGPRMGAAHDVRVKVSQRHGARMDWGDLAVMSVRPEAQLLQGELTSADQTAVAQWIRLNEQPIVDHWNGEIDGVGLALALRKLEP